VLPPAIAAKAVASAGREVVLGLRPEDVDEHGELRAGETVHGRVTSVLPVGSDQFLGVEVEGVPVFVRVGKDFHHRSGENVALAANAARLQLFDKSTGQSVMWR
jgi:multiple sugar transport system ATP-binding protein